MRCLNDSRRNTGLPFESSESDRSSQEDSGEGSEKDQKMVLQILTAHRKLTTTPFLRQAKSLERILKRI